MNNPRLPLLTSALEDLRHAGEHLNSKNPADMKYVVLHSDSAIELILLEGLRVKGNSITMKDGKTKSFHACINELEHLKARIPEKGSIDFIHMMRNSAQHIRFKPDNVFAEWAYAVATEFINEFCINVLEIDMSQEFPEQLSMTALDHLNQAHKSFNKDFYSASVFFALTAAETMLASTYESEDEDEPVSFQLRVITANLPPELEESLLALRTIRNQIVHGFGMATSEQAEITLKVVQKLQEFLSKRKVQSENE